MRRTPISSRGSVARPAERALHNAHNVGAGPPRRQAPQHPGGSNNYAYLAIDFGIARAATDTRLTSASSAIGTWAYMAPERFNSAEVHPSSDIYALACVLYQCLTGQQPFPGSTLEQVAVGHMVTPPPRPSERAAIQPALDQVIATGLAKQPADRYSTTVEMASAAKEAVTGTTPSGAVPPPPPPPPWRHPRRAALGDSRGPRWATRRPLTRRRRRRSSVDPTLRSSVPRRRHRRSARDDTAACSSAPWCSSRHWSSSAASLPSSSSPGTMTRHPLRLHQRPPPASTSAAPTGPITGLAPISMTSRCRMRLRRRIIGPSARSAARQAAWRRRRTSAARRFCRI